MALDKAIELSLRTWYPVDHPLHNDPLHPALGLAGEAGELLDLYKKEKYKNGVSWWDCAKCGHSKDSHIPNGELGYFCNHPQISDATGLEYDCLCPGYTPKILDELGDMWFYLRILAYQLGIKDFEDIANDIGTTISIMTEFHEDYDIVDILIYMSYRATNVLRGIKFQWQLDEIKKDLFVTYTEFVTLLNILDFTLDQVTESNWQKLKDGDNHGWKKARDTVP